MEWFFVVLSKPFLYRIDNDTITLSSTIVPSFNGTMATWFQTLGQRIVSFKEHVSLLHAKRSNVGVRK